MKRSFSACFRGVVAAACAVCATGCQSLLEGTPFAPRPNTDDARVAYMLQQTERDTTRLKARVEAFEQLIQRLEARIIEAERQARDVAQLREELREARDDRARLKTEISQGMGAAVKRMLDEHQAQTLAQIQKAVAAARPAPPPRQSGYNHTVENGQTLSLIAREYKTSVSAIVKANNLGSADVLKIGQVLFIPDN